MSYGALVMYGVALVAGGGGAAMLLRLAGSTLSEELTYAFRIAGTMAVMLGLVLAGFATALWFWGRAA